MSLSISLLLCSHQPKDGTRTHYGCRAHIHLIGKDSEEVRIESVQVQHSCLAEDSQRKRNYKMSEIAILSEAVALYQPTTSREGNAKQLTEIARASTGFDIGRIQAYRSIHERAHDSVHAQIGQYVGVMATTLRVLQ